MATWGLAWARRIGVRRTLVLLAALIALPAHSGTTTYTYDALGRLTSSTAPTGPTGADQLTTTFVYDAAGNRKTVASQYHDKTPPNPPTGLTAVAEAYNLVQLDWTPSTDVGGGPVASYRIYRDGSLIGSANGPPFNDGSVAATTTYTYTVSAVDPLGNESAQSASASATTPLGPDLVPPSTPANLEGVATSGTQISLAWGASTDTGGSGLAGYQVYRDGGSSPIATTTVPSYTDSSLIPATPYTYTVLAYDNAGNRSQMSNEVQVRTPDTIAPSAPGVPTFNPIGPTSATASWTAASDNVAVTGYRYSLNGGASWVAVGNALSANLTGLGFDTAYTLLVEAGDAAGNWGPSSRGSFTTNSTCTDQMAYVGAETSAGENPTVEGYIAGGQFGSLTPSTTCNGKTITEFTTYVYVEYSDGYWSGVVSAYLMVTGFTSNPGAGWLVSVGVSDGPQVTGASANFGCSGTTCTWSWSGGAAIPGSETLTIVHH